MGARRRSMVGVLGAVMVMTLIAGGGSSAQSPRSFKEVLEQNLDENGFIRVHEQGTANVNVTNESLPVAVSNLPGTQEVKGTVSVDNFPEKQNVGGTVSVDNLPESIAVSNFPETFGVSGAVTVENFPESIAISNLPETQNVSGNVNVGNFPDVQDVRVVNSAAGPEMVAMVANGSGGGIVAVNPGQTQVINFPRTGRGVSMLSIADAEDDEMHVCPIVHRESVASSNAQDGDGRVFSFCLGSQDGPPPSIFQFENPIPVDALQVRCFSDVQCQFRFFMIG